MFRSQTGFGGDPGRRCSTSGNLLAGATHKSEQTFALETVHSVHTCTAVLTGMRLALVHLYAAILSGKAPGALALVVVR